MLSKKTAPLLFLASTLIDFYIVKLSSGTGRKAKVTKFDLALK